MQLDIFEDSRDVMLHNDVLAALLANRAQVARRAWQALGQEYPQDELLPSLATLLKALEERDSESPAPRMFESHENLRQARLALQDWKASRRKYGSSSARAHGLTPGVPMPRTSWR